jgi:hypothetical protein
MDGFTACDISRFFCNTTQWLEAETKLLPSDTTQKLMVTTFVHPNYGLHRCE